MHMSADEPSPRPQPSARKYYFLSTAFALACLVGIAFIWYRTYNAPFRAHPAETIVTTQEQVDAYLREKIKSPQSGESPIFIPTGVVIQSLEFKGPYTLQVAGYVWQHYANTLPALDKGVVFPEADTTTFTKIYETQQGDETLIGWSFKTTLREQLDYTKYPLDRQQLWLRMWHVEFEKDVFLEPDVRGYSSLSADTLPGLDPGLVLENWALDRSYFSYRLVPYESNFGIQNYAPEIPQPEMYFNISIKRYILSPLIARGIAPLVILIQLFVIVMVIGTDTKRLEQFGVRPGAVIFTCAAFFFAMLVAQNGLRDEVKWYGIVYLETVYILTYFVILAVALNSVALVAFPDLRLFQQDNSWVEVSYWPLILFILFLITVLTFG